MTEQNDEDSDDISDEIPNCQPHEFKAHYFTAAIPRQDINITKIPLTDIYVTESETDSEKNSQQWSGEETTSCDLGFDNDDIDAPNKPTDSRQMKKQRGERKIDRPTRQRRNSADCD